MTRTQLITENALLRQALLQAGISCQPVAPYRPADWPQGKYPVIYADPPWHFKAGITGRHAGNHYDLLDVDKLAGLPMGELAADDCALFLWVTQTMLPHAFYCLSNWGFTFVTRPFSWIKTAKKNTWSYPFGMGFWSRANGEDIWLCTKGSPHRRPEATGVPGLLCEWLEGNEVDVKFNPRREHSRKPEDFHQRIEQLIEGPYLELFGRQNRPGWTVWGNEVGKFDEQQLALEVGAF